MLWQEASMLVNTLTSKKTTLDDNYSDFIDRIGKAFGLINSIGSLMAHDLTRNARFRIAKSMWV